MNLGKYPQCENGRNLLSQFFHEKLREIKVFVSKITLKAVFTKYFFLVRANFSFFHHDFQYFYAKIREMSLAKFFPQ